MYKVVLKFKLKEGTADEEIRRSREPRSFPNRLAKQPGCQSIELVKIDESTTMSVQTWTSQKDWWAALEAANSETETADPERENILESREFFAGDILEALTGNTA